jgi:hypothetical protein
MAVKVQGTTVITDLREIINSQIEFDNTNSELNSTNVQDAITEAVEKSELDSIVFAIALGG